MFFKAAKISLLCVLSTSLLTSNVFADCEDLLKLYQTIHEEKTLALKDYEEKLVLELSELSDVWHKAKSSNDKVAEYRAASALSQKIISGIEGSFEIAAKIVNDKIASNEDVSKYSLMIQEKIERIMDATVESMEDAVRIPYENLRREMLEKSVALQNTPRRLQNTQALREYRETEAKYWASRAALMMRLDETLMTNGNDIYDRVLKLVFETINSLPRR